MGQAITNDELKVFQLRAQKSKKLLIG